MAAVARSDLLYKPLWSFISTCCSVGVGDGGARNAPPPEKNQEKYFSVNYHLKFEHFSGKYHLTRSLAIAGRPCDAKACQG